jgi:hypothetical protein
MLYLSRLRSAEMPLGFPRWQQRLLLDVSRRSDTPSRKTAVGDTATVSISAQRYGAGVTAMNRL